MIGVYLDRKYNDRGIFELFLIIQGDIDPFRVKMMRSMGK